MYGLEKENKGRVKAEIIDATTPENKEKIRSEFGFKTHGLVIYDAIGNIGKLLDGHLLKEPEIRGALTEVLSAAAETGGGGQAP